MLRTNIPASGSEALNRNGKVCDTELRAAQVPALGSGVQSEGRIRHQQLQLPQLWPTATAAHNRQVRLQPGYSKAAHSLGSIVCSSCLAASLATSCSLFRSLQCQVAWFDCCDDRDRGPSADHPSHCPDLGRNPLNHPAASWHVASTEPHSSTTPASARVSAASAEVTAAQLEKERRAAALFGGAAAGRAVAGAAGRRGGAARPTPSSAGRQAPSTPG